MFFLRISKSVQNLRSIICHFWSVNPTPSTRCVFPLSMLHIIFPSPILVGNIHVAAQSLFHVCCVFVEHSDSAQYNFPCCWKYLVSKILGARLWANNSWNIWLRLERFEIIFGFQAITCTPATSCNPQISFSLECVKTIEKIQSKTFSLKQSPHFRVCQYLDINDVLEGISYFHILSFCLYQAIGTCGPKDPRFTARSRGLLKPPYTWQICETFVWFPQTTWCCE